jgi:hypothetical protein
MNDLIHKFNVEENIKHFKKDLILECENQRTILTDGNNFPVKSIYLNFLYNIFYINSKKCLNNFSFKDIDFQLWAYITDHTFNKTSWHNHISSSTINGVLYLETQKKGIYFKHKKKIIHIEPKNGDLLIFPNFLEHCPEVSFNEKRITLNLEIRCNEESKDIFKL